MPTNFQVRTATSEDLDAIRDLNRKLFSFDRQFDPLLAEMWADSAEGKGYFAERVREDDGFVAVSCVENDIAGYIAGGIQKRVSYRVEAVYAELENMYILKEFRGAGIGSDLARAFIDWCGKKHVDHIFVTASAQNENAIRFYRSLGFSDHDTTLRLSF